MSSVGKQFPSVANVSSANTSSVFPLQVNVHMLVLNVDPLRYSRVLIHQFLSDKMLPDCADLTRYHLSHFPPH